MTIAEILRRLEADGYVGCYVPHWDTKSILVPTFGEVELAHGEAKIFDSKYAWPEYGGHKCHKNIDALFEDIHSTWPLVCKPSSPEFETSSDSSAAVPEIAIKDEALVIVTEANNDSVAISEGSVPTCPDASAVCVGVATERTPAPGS